MYAVDSASLSPLTPIAHLVVNRKCVPASSAHATATATGTLHTATPSVVMRKIESQLLPIRVQSDVTHARGSHRTSVASPHHLLRRFAFSASLSNGESLGADSRDVAVDPGPSCTTYSPSNDGSREPTVVPLPLAVCSYTACRIAPVDGYANSDELPIEAVLLSPPPARNCAPAGTSVAAFAASASAAGCESVSIRIESCRDGMMLSGLVNTLAFIGNRSLIESSRGRCLTFTRVS